MANNTPFEYQYWEGETAGLLSDYYSCLLFMIKCVFIFQCIIFILLPTFYPSLHNTHTTLNQVAQLEKLHLKNQALKVQEKKLQQQLRHKKEMGKAEYEVEKVRLYNTEATKAERKKGWFYDVPEDCRWIL